MPIRIELAITIAENNIKEIRRVEDWANQLGYVSSNFFSRIFRNHFGESPKAKLTELRLNRFFKIIEERPRITCYILALEVGLKDEVVLNKFIKRHTGKSPTHWKTGNENG